MMRRLCPCLFLSLLALSACQPARRYPESGPKPADRVDAKEDPELRRLSWVEQRPGPDVPIVFVADTHPDWYKLKSFWNAPSIPAALSHLGQSPLGAAIAAAFAEQSVRIKVPRGLPDPTPNIPAVNLPTLAKWRLG
ncbi:MAG TPA: hypothetical protein VFE62_10220, partial [Gemmataceae bacterium]|nr:hypothetical protein [Gemmataceae bacterium]